MSKEYSQLRVNDQSQRSKSVVNLGNHSKCFEKKFSAQLNSKELRNSEIRERQKSLLRMSREKANEYGKMVKKSGG